MYEYIAGKVDWMAYGLPVEGEAGPYAGEVLVPVPTCLPSDPVRAVAARLEAAGEERAVVVASDEDPVVAGEVDRECLRAASATAAVLEVMEPSPSTIRPSVPLADLDDRAAGKLVTTPLGHLLGAVDPAAVAHRHHDEAAKPTTEEVERELDEVLAEVADRFGEREPTKDELRGLLRDRLVAQGRSDAEAERVLEEMEESSR